jgi:hypothetical protein
MATEPKEPGKLVRHADLKACSRIADVMDELVSADRWRVMRWLLDKYGPYTDGLKAPPAAPSLPPEGD